ncbi:hypothetical protein BASA83_005210 [Batrachochytrium salamandrivorans]|nr:hypothetical protein BASA83_005210 [Batrachochytrium salamandrivorans]
MGSWLSTVFDDSLRILPMETDSLLDKSLDITGCTYYPTQYDQSVSPQCRDILQKMLTIDPDNRITMPQIMDHPWLSGI